MTTSLIGGAGDDTLDGGAGNDRAVYTGSHQDFTVTVNGTSATVTDSDTTVSGQGTDSLSDIEELQFDDGVFFIDGRNNAPTAASLSQGTDEDAPLTISKGSLIDLGNDFDGDALTLSVGNSINGSVDIIGDNVIFTPLSNFNGTASFDYTLSDGNGGTVTETVTVDVASVNDAPTSSALLQGTDEDAPPTISKAILIDLVIRI